MFKLKNSHLFAWMNSTEINRVPFFSVSSLYCFLAIHVTKWHSHHDSAHASFGFSTLLPDSRLLLHRLAESCLYLLMPASGQHWCIKDWVLIPEVGLSCAKPGLFQFGNVLNLTKVPSVLFLWPLLANIPLNKQQTAPTFPSPFGQKLP